MTIDYCLFLRTADYCLLSFPADYGLLSIVFSCGLRTSDYKLSKKNPGAWPGYIAIGKDYFFAGAFAAAAGAAAGAAAVAGAAVVVAAGFSVDSSWRN